jgi:hypothetical protein
MHGGALHQGRIPPTTCIETAADRSILRYDSASSELAYLQQERAWHAAGCGGQPHSGPPGLGFERGSWGSDGSGSSTSTHGPGEGHVGGELAERWDSAQSDTFEIAISAQQEAGLQEQSLRQREQLRRLQQQRLAAAHGCTAEPAREGGGPHQEGQLRDSGAMPTAASDEGDGPWAPRPRRAAGPHALASEDRVRQPRRRRSSGKPPPRARRCLGAAFAAAADAQRLQRLDEAPTHSACPSLPGCCPAGADMQMGGDEGHPAHGTWQPGGLWEVMRGAPAGLSDEAARSVLANVAYALLRMHEDGLVHRHVSLCTVVLGEIPCFDTARHAPLTSQAYAYVCLHAIV